MSAITSLQQIKCFYEQLDSCETRKLSTLPTGLSEKIYSYLSVEERAVLRGASQLFNTLLSKGFDQRATLNNLESLVTTHFTGPLEVKNLFITRIALLWERANMTEVARKTAELIVGERQKNQASIQLLLASRNSRAAENKAHCIEDQVEKEHALLVIAEQMAKEQLFNKAKRLLGQIKSSTRRDAYFLARVRQYLCRRTYKAAYPIAEQITDSNSKNEAYRAIASREAMAGDTIQAIRVVNLIQEVQVQNEVRSSIASRAAELRRWDEAQNISSTIMDTTIRDKTFILIALQQLLCDRWQEAKIMITFCVEDSEKRNSAYAAIARLEATLVSTDRAQTTLALIDRAQGQGEEHYHRAHFYIYLTTEWDSPTFNPAQLFDSYLHLNLEEQAPITTVELIVAIDIAIDRGEWQEAERGLVPLKPKDKQPLLEQLARKRANTDLGEALRLAQGLELSGAKKVLQGLIAEKGANDFRAALRIANSALDIGLRIELLLTLAEACD